MVEGALLVEKLCVIGLNEDWKRLTKYIESSHFDTRFMPISTSIDMDLELHPIERI